MNTAKITRERAKMIMNNEATDEVFFIFDSIDVEGEVFTATERRGQCVTWLGPKGGRFTFLKYAFRDELGL